MGPGAAQPGVPGVPFPHTSNSAEDPSDDRIPRSVAAGHNRTKDAKDENDYRADMDVDDGETTPVKRPTGSATLPSIKNLFGIERADNLRNVRRPPSAGSSFSPGSPSSSARTPLASSARAERGPYGHSSSSSFSSLSGASGSSFGPMRHRQSSTSGSLGRAGIPNTPPRQGAPPHMFQIDDAGRRRVDSRPQPSLKGLMMSPPPRRGLSENEGYSDLSTTPQRHRPGSSTGSAPVSQILVGPDHAARASPGHVSTLSDPSPMMMPAYAPSSLASAESSNQDTWGAASTQSESTSPRTSWHSRSSTLESGESVYKMGMGEMMRDRAPPLLPPFREPGHAALDLLRRSPEQAITSLTRHGSLRMPQTSGEANAAGRPRARTLTFSDRPIAPLPGSNDPARRQHLEAASELLRMGRGPEAPTPTGRPSGRHYHHKHSASMQERTPLPLDIYTSEQIDTRGHRPKSSSMSARGPHVPPGALYSATSQLERPELSPPGAFDSFHPRRGRGSAEDPVRPGANFVFPRRPMPDTAEAQRATYQSQMMRGQGLPSVPDGIVSGRAGPGGSPRSSATGTIASGQAKYECAWCGKRFSRPSSLKIHHHSHTGEKPFVCNEPGCGRSFSVQSNLRRHQKCHVPGNESIEPTGRSHSERSAGPSRSDDAEMWARGQVQPDSLGHHASASWHAHHPSQHSFGSMQQIKDHPPLSRSAFEPGSRSMGSWSDMHQHHTHERGPRGLEPPFTQLRERRLSESSGEEEEEETGRSEILLVKESPGHSTGSLHRRGPSSVFSSDDEERAPASRVRSGTVGSTSGIRVGFSSLLNPTAEASIDESQ